jgi:hemolysin activation/secretion protein
MMLLLLLSRKVPLLFFVSSLLYCLSIIASPENVAFSISRDYLARPMDAVTEQAPDALQLRAGTLVVNQIKLRGNTVYSDEQLHALFSSTLGKPLSLDGLRQIAYQIQQFYYDHGYILATVVIPMQTAKAGVVAFDIYEGKIDSVVLNKKPNDDFKSDDQLLREQAQRLSERAPQDSTDALLAEYAEKLKSSQPLTVNEMSKYILLIRQVYGVSVKDVTLGQDNTGYGNGQLVIAYERKSYGFNASYGNYFSNNIFASENVNTFAPEKNNIQNIGLGASAHNVLRASDELGAKLWYVPNYHQDGKNPAAYSYYYNTLLNKKGLVGGLYANSFQGGSIRQNTYGAKLEYPLILSDANQTQLFFHVEHTEYNDNDNSFSLTPIRVGLANILSGPFAKNSIKIRFNHGVNVDTSIHNYASEYKTNFSSVDYYQVLNVLIPFLPRQSCLENFHTTSDMSEKRKRDLGCSSYPIALLLASNGQFSKDHLLNSEIFGFGGYDFGRGYVFNQLTGDSGIAGKAEIQLNKGVGKNRYLLQGVQPYLFTDYGIAWLNSTDANSAHSRHGWSTGAGMRFYFGEYVTADLFLAKPLLHINDDHSDSLGVTPFFYINASL